MLWRKFNGDAIHLPIKDAVEEAIKRETASGNKLKVCIGTDSQVKGRDTEFATVIVFLREGRGGFMFIHNEKTLKANTASKKGCWWKWQKVLKLLMNFATCLQIMM